MYTYNKTTFSLVGIIIVLILVALLRILFITLDEYTKEGNQSASKQDTFIQSEAAGLGSQPPVIEDEDVYKQRQFRADINDTVPPVRGEY